MIFPLHKYICKYKGKTLTNAGDEFSHYLVNKMIINVTGITDDGAGYADNCRFLITGSIASGANGYSYLMGCGVIKSEWNINNFNQCYVVRGYKTLEKAVQSRPNYDFSTTCVGDPGLLMSFLIDCKPPVKYKYGIVLHYVDHEFISEYFDHEFLSQCLIIDITDNIDHIASGILSCQYIISSSLHGLIFAHSLDKPAYWIRLSNTVLMDDNFKFLDYLSTFKLDNNNYLNLITNKVNNTNIDQMTIIPVPNNIQQIKSKLLNKIISVFKSFKYNLTDRFTQYSDPYMIDDILLHDQLFTIPLLSDGVKVNNPIIQYSKMILISDYRVLSYLHMIDITDPNYVYDGKITDGMFDDLKGVLLIPYNKYTICGLLESYIVKNTHKKIILVSRYECYPELKYSNITCVKSSEVDKHTNFDIALIVNANDPIMCYLDYIKKSCICVPHTDFLMSTSSR